jgi:DNA repair photolyase
MPLKESKGNMYPWVTHTHTHLGGECPHKCVYCYVDNPRWGRPARYKGNIRLIESEFKVKYGEDKTIFIENCNDLLAEKVPDEFIRRIISHCNEYPRNTYVFQTKNPTRYLQFLHVMPPQRILGCTIETNRNIAKVSKAPKPIERARDMTCLVGQRLFVTIEPVLDFDVDILADWIRRIKPEFLNLGADSKGHSLPEPSLDKIVAFTGKLKEYGIELREKHNLNRLAKEGKDD